ncbi:hypothetical protein OK348_02985 [Flavobacterium sp. MXW15]|uniref:Adhesin n=1 Tax=Xanthomonas chitinilytica TaxID=2989819 RepID=A0ABT3JRT0_9XANT|nr:adhesin [Xanthomonas sp. H13-6]MCW4453761.1 hypothetical protein [Flavobacterium sp. MXW15]MCW4471191.1 adhesin [Xanthomonas sp. H13-6]
MNANIRKTAIALAVAAVAASPAAFAQDNQNASALIIHKHIVIEDWDTNVDDTRNYTTNTTTNTNTNTNTTTNTTTNNSNTDVNLALNAEANLLLNAEANLLLNVEGNYSESISNTESYNRSENYWSNEVYENIDRTSNIQADERKEKNNHGVDVNLEKDLRLSSDINFSGDPTITGSIDLDSAAIAVIDNRQSITGNKAANQLLTNDAYLTDNVAAGASGNLGFNVAAGDNNTQDNAAALSAADASFSFGMADAEVFVNQYGAGNTTLNHGVTNAAGVGGSAFSGASGNIGVNVTSGNNNEQKNALAASVATSAYAQSSISSNQVSTGNVVSNSGYAQKYTDTVQVSLSGPVRGYTASVGAGAYEGSGAAYQMDNYYLDTWSGALPHANGNSTGHIDLDNEIQNATANPNRPGVGGIAFDTEESGTLGFVELGYSDLYASLSGTVTTSRWVVVNATNTAALSGDAFSGASGNIGVNVASGSGNLQANSLALAVAQPSTGGGGGGTE